MLIIIINIIKVNINMLLESLSDFFLFISSDKKVINDKDVKAFECFLGKQFTNVNAQQKEMINDTNVSSVTKVSKNIYSFLNELLFYLLNQNIIQLYSNCYEVIDSKSIDVYKQRFSISSATNSKRTYLKQIKNKETKKMLMHLLKHNKLQFNIEPECYLAFFNYTGKYAKVVAEFMNIMKTWYDSYKSVLDKHKSKMNGDNNNVSDDKSKSDLDKSNEDNKSGLSGVSYDKENVVKDKKKFLEVLDRIRDNVSVDDGKGKGKEGTVDQNDIEISISNNKGYSGNNSDDRVINKSKNGRNNIKKSLSDDVNIVVPSNDVSNNTYKMDGNNNRKRNNKDGCNQCCLMV